MPLNWHHTPYIVHKTYQFSELLLQVGVPNDLDAAAVCAAGLVIRVDLGIKTSFDSF